MIRVTIDGEDYEVVPVLARSIDPATERWFRRFDVPDEVFFNGNARMLVDELRKSGVLGESKRRDEQGNVVYTSELYVLKMETLEKEEV